LASVGASNVVGASANLTLQEILNDANSSGNGLDIAIGVLTVCDLSCVPGTADNSDKDEVSFSLLLSTVLAVVIVLFLILLIVFGLLALQMR